MFKVNVRTRTAILTCLLKHEVIEKIGKRVINCHRQLNECNHYLIKSLLNASIEDLEEQSIYTLVAILAKMDEVLGFIPVVYEIVLI